MSFTYWRYPTRRFSVDGLSFSVSSRARNDGLHSTLCMIGVEQSADHTPVFGPESVRNHLLQSRLPDGRMLEVEFGYMGLWTSGVVARVDGVLVYESHEGRVPAYPEKYQNAALQHSNYFRARTACHLRLMWQQGYYSISWQNSLICRLRLCLAFLWVLASCFFSASPKSM
jgi:hypothetical protein